MYSNNYASVHAYDDLCRCRGRKFQDKKDIYIVSNYLSTSHLLIEKGTLSFNIYITLTKKSKLISPILGQKDIMCLLMECIKKYSTLQWFPAKHKSPLSTPAEISDKFKLRYILQNNYPPQKCHHKKRQRQWTFRTFSRLTETKDTWQVGSWTWRGRHKG